MTNVPMFQTLPEPEDTYDMPVLSEMGKSLKVSATQRIHDISRPQDNYGFQVLFENIDIVGKELDKLHTAESTPVLHKSEDDMYKESCASNSNAEVPRFLVKDENKKSSYKIDDQCTLLDLFVSSERVHNSSQIFEGKDDSFAVGCEEQPSTDFTNPVSLTSICNLNDDFSFPELFYSSPNIFSSNLDLKCEVRNGAKKKIMCSESVDRYSIVPLIVHDTFPQNEIQLMPGPDKYEEFPDVNAHSYQIAGINKLVSDIINSKEELSSLYDSTTIKMKEVELQEGSSRKAKQDAVKAHQYFAAMVEYFNRLIEYAKESNDKEAQIVKEEKSLLAALAQDLHSRLTKLSAERDEAFTIVEEIKLKLDARLATLIEEEAAAREHISQHKKLDLLVRKKKEVELGGIMKKSSKLQKKAEKKLLFRDFLSDCGRTTDIL